MTSFLTRWAGQTDKFQGLFPSRPYNTGVCAGDQSMETPPGESTVYNIVHRRWTNVDLMLGRRRRRWPSIRSTLSRHLVFDEWFTVQQDMKLIIDLSRTRTQVLPSPQQTRDAASISVEYWATVADCGPVLSKCWFSVVQIQPSVQIL